VPGAGKYGPRQALSSQGAEIGNLWSQSSPEADPKICAPYDL